MPNDDAYVTQTFQPVGQYAWPTMPADDVVRGVFSRIVSRFSDRRSPPTVTAMRLDHAPLDKLNQIAPLPACGPLLGELDNTLQDWKHRAASEPVLLIVLPPCDSNNAVRQWAEQKGATILSAPSRDFFRSGVFEPTVEIRQVLQAESLVVIPRLEEWFLRHFQGLAAVRWLLSQLVDRKQPCVIGCNSWAWSFLTRAIRANLFLPTGLTFQAFDGERLHAWFKELAAQDTNHPLSFRLAQNGKTVLSTETDQIAKDYFKRLAAQSLGIPWVAWQLWRQSLHFRKDGDSTGVRSVPDVESQAGEAQSETLWVAPQGKYKLPEGSEQHSLLVLHTLLIHGALTLDELSHVLSTYHSSGIVHALIAAGFIRRDSNSFTCTSAAYPAVRQSLSSAGFPVDKL